MQNSPGSDQTSNSTTAKLLEVDSQLAVQEAELLSQLESVQEKRKSLKTVLCLFTKADTLDAAPIAEPSQIQPAQTNQEPERIGEDLTGPPFETSRQPDTAQSETEAVEDSDDNGAKKQASSPTKENKTTKVTRPAKAAKKTLRWQDYLREEFSNASLPEAVTSVLQRQADKVWEIPNVMNAIFVDELPQEVGHQARRQVTNILSDGARKNKWYRGQLGQYSMSRVAALSQ